jgi:uncharacterized repeat protein (TIGR01451 family)
VVSGTFSGATNRELTLDFYSSVAVNLSGYGEGQVYLGTTNLTTDDNGLATFTATLPVTNLVGRYITATATDTNGNTSEFAAAIAAESTVLGTTFIVVNTNDAGPGSLRQAILDANTNISAGDTIAFAITNLDTVISPASALPTLMDPVTIDGYTQSGSAPNSAPAAFNGVLPVVLSGSSAGAGVDGLRFTVHGNTVRGLHIINFTQNGLLFTSSHSNVVEGCVIGLDSASVDRGNASDGVRLVNSAWNRIGGDTLAARNVISGNNDDGIEINGVTAAHNIVVGNCIGLDLTGTLDRGNGDGIVLTAAPSNRIGGTNTTERNVISGNNFGIYLQTTGATNNLIVGNYVGTDGSGTLDLGNSNEGIFVSAVPHNIIGTPGAGNVISGNGGDGIEINGGAAATNTIQANYIGTDVAGTTAIANANNGVFLSSAVGNRIGGAAVGEGNLISGNSNDGVEISGSAAAGNVVQGNSIGVAAGGLTGLPNGAAGVFLTTTAHDNQIGGAANRIAFNGTDGIWVNTGTNNAIRANLIHDNGDLGIDLGTSGVSTNDPGDADSGANQLQNYPVLAAATNGSAEVVIVGSLDSAAGTAYDLEFFASQELATNGFGEGQFFLGSTHVTTDGSGHVDFVASFPVTLSGRYVTATATDPFGNTSEFSGWVPANSTVAATNLVVTTTNDSGPGSLREAIQIANQHISAGGDTITFAIPGSGVQSINVSNALPVLQDPVLIDGFTQPGASANTLCSGNNAVLRVALYGGFATGSMDGLRLAGLGNCTVRGLSLNTFPGNGITVLSGTNHQVAGCQIGLDTTGAAAGNTGKGVQVLGPAAANRIGGGEPEDRNVIGGNLTVGVQVENSAGNVIAGNFIGTDPSGSAVRGNATSGVQLYLAGSVSNVVGGTTACARNVISGNGSYYFSDHHGVDIYSAKFNSVLGNYIGLDASGSNLLGNAASGVRLRAASFNTVGDGTPAGRNIISANYYGVELELTSPSNSVAGNYIGTDVSGMLDRGNYVYGLLLAGGSYNLVSGNLVSGNNNDALYVAGNVSPGNRLRGNWIGVDATGTGALGNFGAGIRIEQSETAVGGTNISDGNIIAFNSGHGVWVLSGDVNCPILGNSIYENGSLGIDLDALGVTLNDPGDADSGGNNRQNFPVVTEAIQFPTETLVNLSLNSTPGTDFRVELFLNTTNDPTGHGEGQTYLGFTHVTTDGAGDVAFSFTHAAALPLNQTLSATATDPAGNTSEFSAGRRIVTYDSVDVALSITDSADPAPHATNLVYTLSLTNYGPTNATGVWVTNPLPAGVTFVGSTPSQGSVTPISGTLLWNVGTLNDGSGATLAVEVASTLTGYATHTATVRTAEADNDPANNAAVESTLLGIADIAVSVVDSPDPVTAGQPVTFTVTVTNAGPDPATVSTLNFSIHQDFFITAGSVSQGTLQTGAGYFYAQLGMIPVGGTATLTGTAIPVQTGNLSLSAQVTRAESDPNPANNTFANGSTTVDPGAGVFEFLPAVYDFVEGGGATLHVRRLGGSLGTVTVDFATSNLTALAGSDYTAVISTLTFTNGETLQSVTVSLTDDALAECNEQFTTHLLNPTGGAIVLRNTNQPVMIFDNEVSPSGTMRAISSTDTNLPPDAGDGNSQKSSVSADGRYVAFSSYARNLVTADQNSTQDVFVRDLLTQTTVLASRPTGSSSSGNSSSHSARISGDGRYVVFRSAADDLAADDNNFTDDVFVRDLLTQTTILVSHNAANTGAADDYSFAADPGRMLISSNGQGVVFASYATDVSALPDSNFDADAFYHDLASGTNRLLSVNLAGTASGNNWATDPVISGNGQVVAFESAATDLTALPDANSSGDVFVQDLALGINELVSVNLAGAATANGMSSTPYLNHDGRYVAFESYAADLATNDTNTRTDVFWRDRVAGVTVLVSVNTNGVAGNNYSTVRGVSADGRYVVFSSHCSDLVPGDTNGSEDVFVRDLIANVTVLVSRTAGGDPGNNASFNPVLSGDGTHVAFESYATDLTPAPKSSDYRDVFVRDLTNGLTRLVSYRNGTTNAPSASSYDAAISHDGNVTSFTGDPENGGGEEMMMMAMFGSIEYSDIWAHTFATNTTELVSVASGSATGNSYSFDVAVSASGQHVVFASYAENLTSGDTNQNGDVFLFNLTNHTATLVSVNASNSASGNGYSDLPDVSADGRYVAFASSSSDLVTGDTNNVGDIFQRDLAAGTTALVSINQSGTGPGNSDSLDPHMTPDGRFVVFQTMATNLFANDLNGTIEDIVLRDMTSNVVELISVTVSGSGSGSWGSYYPAISDDGRFVAYQSLATNLVTGDTNNLFDVFLRDRQSGTNLLCSRAVAGAGPGNNESTGPVLSGNGQIVVFFSYATNLVAGDTNSGGDLFAFDTAAHTLQLVSAGLGGGAANGVSFNPAISADGRYVAFESDATNLVVANDSNGFTGDVFLRDLVSGTTTLVSGNCQGTGSADNYSYGPSISAAGRYIVYHSTAMNLVGGWFATGTDNVYRYDRLSGETVLVSQNRFRTGGGNGNSYAAQGSATGGTVAFLSGANNLVADDFNNTDDVFVWQDNFTASGVDLALVKTASEASIAQGSGFSYTLAVTNLGTAGATGVVVTDPLPAGLSYVSASASQGTLTNSSGTITANLGSLAAGAGANVVITVTASTAGSVSNYAGVTAVESDDIPANNSDFVLVTVTPFTPPPLVIEPTNSTQVVLRWPASTPAGFALETTPNLAPVVIWSPVTNSVVIIATNRVVILDVNFSEPERYYRLRQ